MQRSETLGNLTKALVAARVAIKSPTRNKTANIGKFSYSYADLPAVLDSYHAAFATNGLAAVQTVGQNNTLTTMLLHSSGEWISDTMDINPTSTEPQKIGSAITYARRYALSALAGIAAEDDDDAASHVKSHEARPSPVLPQIVQREAVIEHHASGLDTGLYVVPFGKYKGKQLRNINSEDIDSYCAFLLGKAREDKKPLSESMANFYRAIDSYLGTHYERMARGTIEDVVRNEIPFNDDLPIPF